MHSNRIASFEFVVRGCFANWRNFDGNLRTISALTALADNRQFTLIAQNYALRVSDFVRKYFSRARGNGNDGNIGDRSRSLRSNSCQACFI